MVFVQEKPKQYGTIRYPSFPLSSSVKPNLSLTKQTPEKKKNE